jgi:hypothetical protein
MGQVLQGRGQGADVDERVGCSLGKAAWEGGGMVLLGRVGVK